MVTVTSEDGAPNSNVRSSNVAPCIDSRVSNGALYSDAQLGALYSDAQLGAGASNLDAQLSHVASSTDPQHDKLGRKKSIVWKYFTLETVDGNCTRAFCKKCKQSFAYICSSQKMAGTSHLKRHLKRHIAHKSFQGGCKKVPKSEVAGNEGAPSRPSSGLNQAPDSREKSLFDQRKDERILKNLKKRRGDVQSGKRNSDFRRGVHMGFDMDNGGEEYEPVDKSEVETNGSMGRGNLTLIVKMIIQHGYPLDMVEHAGFIDFVGALQSQYKIGSISTIEEQIIGLYSREKENICNILAGTPGSVSLTLDFWPSDQSFGYVILTGQFVDCDWKLQRRILNVVWLPFPDSEVAFNDAVAACTRDWSFEDKLFSLTLNENFSSEIVRRNLRGLLSTKNPTIFNGQLIIGSCYAHTLSGVARKALVSLGAIVEKVRKNVKYVVTSVAHREIFSKLRQQLALPSMKILDIDDQTKWNTTYEMLMAASEMKEVYLRLDTLDPEYKVTVSVEEWRQVEILIVYLNLLYDAASILNAGAYPTADIFFHEVWKIQVELMHGASSVDVFMSNLTKPLKELFDTYWKACSLILAVAVVMDPRFKMKLVEFSFSEIYGKDAESWIKEIDEELHQLFLEYFEESLPPPPFINTIAESTVKTDISQEDSLLSTCNDFLDFDFYLAEIMGDPDSKSELDVYLEEPLLPHVQDFDVLGWWRLNSLKYPTLSRMASDILCISISTVSDQDRVFDMPERKMDRQQSTLKPTVLEALVCAKDWLQF